MGFGSALMMMFMHLNDSTADDHVDSYIAVDPMHELVHTEVLKNPKSRSRSRQFYINVAILVQS